MNPALRSVINSSSPDPFGERYQQYFDTIHQLKTKATDGKGEATSEQIETVKQGVSAAAKGIGGLFLPEVGGEALKKAAELMVDGAQLALSEKDRLVDLVQRHQATKANRALQELILQPV